MSKAATCRFNPDAADDLEEVWRHLATEASEDTASWYIGLLVDSAKLVSQFPGMGRRRDEIKPGWRSVAEGSHVLFYREIEGGIELMRVIHGSRDLEQLFHDKEERD